ncbi:MAG: ATP-binding protein [Bacteroidales bacterium]
MKRRKAKIRDIRELRKDAESRVIPDLNAQPIGENDDPRKLMHELQVHQIELEIQNEELRNTRESLEAVLEKHDDFYDFAPVGYFSFSRTGVILETNLTAASMLGVDRARLTGKLFQNYIQDKVSAYTFRNLLNEVFDNRKKGACQLSITNSENHGLFIHLEVSIPLNDNKCLAVASDITELKKSRNDLFASEKKLHDTNSYLEHLINFANAPIIVWNPGFEIQVFNRASERLTGYNAQEVIGKKLDILFPGISRKKSIDMIKRTLEGRFLESIEIPILTKGKETRMVLWNSANIYATDNISLISTIAQGNDITLRKKAENALVESQRKLEIALDSGNIGIWEWDSAEKKIRIDSRTEKLLGIDGTTFDGSLKSLEDLVVQEDLAHLRAAFRRTINEVVPFETVIRVKPEGKSMRHLVAKGQCHRDSSGKVNITAVFFDITEMKKQSEHALFRVNEDLVRSNRDLEQFAYVASHDLQEPLRMISSFTQLLSQQYKDKLDGNALEYIRYAVDGSKRMYDLINGLLAYSRIHTRGKSFQMVDLNIVFEKVMKNVELKINERNACINSENLPVVFADENQMIQLFQNLILNSMKFCEKDPRIDISSQSDNDRYILSFRDNGIGIEPEYSERIFQIFQRLHTNDEYEGTGIGLAICKRIIERHGGTIWVESEHGKGSSFFFTIPKDQAAG